MILTALLASLSLAQPVAAPTPRTVVVISDLHMGPGRSGPTAWDRLEDFRWSNELRAFVEALPSVAAGPVDLVIAGDAFELWQSRDGKCAELADKNLGCTEEEAKNRLLHAAAQHRPAIDTLKGFAAREGNRLVLLAGNHDVALTFPGVREALLKELPGAILPEKGYWLSDDGGVVVDHGHQIDGDPNLFDGWPAPFKTAGAVQHLQRPWGEQFVNEFYTGWEDRFPIVDNISEEAAGAKLAMEALGVPKKLKATKQFFRFFFLDVSWHQFATVLGDEKGQPIWDVAKLRAGGDKALANALPPGDPMAKSLRTGAFKKALALGELKAAVEAFDDEELKAICDQELLRRKAHLKPEEQVVLPCPTSGTLGGDDGTLGGVAQSLLGLKGKALAARMTSLREESGKDFSTYVYGHTHAAQAPWRAINKGDWTPYAVNSGAFQRIATPDQVAAYRKKPNGKRPANEVLRVSLDRLPPCYHYVLVPAGKPDAPELRTWRLRDGKWGSGEAGECAQLPMGGAAVAETPPGSL